MNEKVDVAIVGAGIVGQYLALLLHDFGFKVVLFESCQLKEQIVDGSTPYNRRVSALTGGTEKLFSQVGVWESIVSQRSQPYTKMLVWDGLGTESITFDALSLDKPNLGHIVENIVINQSLLQSLKKTSVTVVDHCGLLEFAHSANGVNVKTESGDVFEAKLLVGADGAHSKVRRWIAIPTRKKDCLHHSIVATVETQKAHNNIARQVFLETGPLAFLPMPDKNGQHFCSIVWSVFPEKSQQLMADTDEGFCWQLEQAFESQLGVVKSVSTRQSFKIAHHHVKQYYYEGVVLVGDAAHTIHPLAGQGVNIGLQDAYALADVLHKARIRGDNIASDDVLQDYQKIRKIQNTVMLSAMDGFQYLFNKKQPSLVWLRNFGLGMVNNSKLIKENIIKYTMGLL